MGRGLDGYFSWYPLVGGLCSFEGPLRRGLDKFPVAIARGKYLFPFRTEQSSPAAPMVLDLQGSGRVGRRRFFNTLRAAHGGGSSSLMAFPDVTTDRLQLSRWDADAHGPALAALNALPDTVRFLNEGVPYTPAESAAQSERFAAHWSAHGFGLWAARI